MYIRKAIIDDLSRVAEIYVFNNRMNFFPIFKDESFSFGELQVVSLVNNYFKKDEIIKKCAVIKQLKRLSIFSVLSVQHMC